MFPATIATVPSGGVASVFDCKKPAPLLDLAGCVKIVGGFADEIFRRGQLPPSSSLLITGVKDMLDKFYKLPLLFKEKVLRLRNPDHEVSDIFGRRTPEEIEATRKRGRELTRLYGHLPPRPQPDGYTVDDLMKDVDKIRETGDPIAD